MASLTIFWLAGVRSLLNCFLLGEVGAPNDFRTAFVGCFDDEVISVFETYEGSPFFFGEVGEFGVAIRFLWMVKQIIKGVW